MVVRTVRDMPPGNAARRKDASDEARVACKSTLGIEEPVVLLLTERFTNGSGNH